MNDIGLLDPIRRKGVNGARPRKPRMESSPQTADCDGADPMPKDLERKFDALPKDVREMFRRMERPIDNAREYCERRVIALRHNGFTLGETITIAHSFPDQFGILGAQTPQVFAEIRAERERQEAEREIPNRLRAQLSAGTWLSRPMPPIDRLLGDFITTTTRAFLVGRTGLGKTMLGLGIAMGIGFGIGFLHWHSSRAARVLYIDGEMPAELLIKRIRDAAQRINREDLIDNVMVFSTEDAEKIAERYPTLGMFEPLNTEAGQEFIKRLVDMLKPDVVIFDNVQSLLIGVQKEEETWIPVLPLVQWLTKHRVGQLWFDHTGHAGERQYGTATKSWRFDAVGQMTPLDDGDREQRETAFLLSFDAPSGKARRRTPDNWAEFAPHIIRLREAVWSSEPVEKRNGNGHALGKVAPSRKIFHNALIDALAHAPTRPGETTMGAWEGECVRRGLIDAIEPGDTSSTKRTKRTIFRTAKSALLAARMIGIDGKRVMDLTRSYG
jgi:hypothetical protein